MRFYLLGTAGYPSLVLGGPPGLRCRPVVACSAGFNLLSVHEGNNFTNLSPQAGEIEYIPAWDPPIDFPMHNLQINKGRGLYHLVTDIELH